MMQLRTPRLSLDPFVLADADDLFSIRGDALAMAHWDWPGVDIGQTRAVAHLFVEDMGRGASIYWTVRGRRPLILRLLGGTDAAGNWSGEFLEHDKGGLRLGEHERHEAPIAQQDTVAFRPEAEDIFYEKLCVEDSLRSRNPIPNSGAYIRKLWA